MSRSGYSDDCCGWDLVRWRGAVASAIRGKRGQEFLKELLAALEAMPKKELIAYHLAEGGQFCAIGVVGGKRGVDMDGFDEFDRDEVAGIFNIAPALVAEIAFMNDEAGWYDEQPEARWHRMRQWVSDQIIKQEGG